MSLDIYLEERIVCPQCSHRFTTDNPHEAYSANITHNLTPMADEAGIYAVVWRPEENQITEARQLIDPLRAGIEAMKSDPARFEKLNAVNGWGLYKNFVPWLERLLAACEEHPEAFVRASR